MIYIDKPKRRSSTGANLHKKKVRFFCSPRALFRREQRVSKGKGKIDFKNFFRNFIILHKADITSGKGRRGVRPV